MKKRLLFAPSLCAAVVATIAAAGPISFDSSRAYGHLRQIVSFGPRPAGSAALEATRGYLRRQLDAIGVPVKDQAFDAATPAGAVRMVNLVATIPGVRPARIVFTGHYDTKVFHEFMFVGANDGGSSAAFLLELARVLKARRNPFTMEVLFLDGEEAVRDWQDDDHTYGSRYYVEAARRAGTLQQIRALILVDMIGARDLLLDRESNSTPWLTDALWKSAKKLGVQEHFSSQPSPIEDDHIPFLRAGVQAVDIIDLNHYAEMGWWHTREDTLDKTSARSLQMVGDVLMDALPGIEARLLKSAATATKPRTTPAKPRK